MAAPERLETARLVLRRPRAEDAEAVFAGYASDPVVTRYMSFATHRALDDTRAFLEHADAEWTRWPAGPHVIEARSDGRLLGATGFGFETASLAGTGYVLARDAWGQGFATEALRAIVDAAPALGLRTLEAECHPANAASLRVLEKCGFTLAGRVLSVFPNLGPAPADTLRYVRLFA